MTELNRRNIMLAVGGVSVLAACKPVGGGPDGPHGGGGEAPYGAYPDQPGEEHFKGSIEFAPQNLCLIYMKIDGAKLTARHAYFGVAAVVGDETGWVIARFAEMAKGGGTSIKPIREEKDFENFNFGSQQKLYFLIDNGDDVIFDDITPITFSPYSSKGGRPNNRTQQKPLLDKNFAFFSARKIESKGIINPNLLYLENWFANKNGKLFDKNTASENYSMDIHLQMKSYADGAVRIPIIIDPDSGNGSSWRP